MNALSLLLDDRAAAIERLHAQTALYTNLDVVDGLLDHLRWPERDNRLLDPSCGDGMFLDRALRRALRAAHGASLDTIADTIEGWEIHQDAASQARDRLTATLVAHNYPTEQAARAAARIVRNHDFLTEGPAGHGSYHVVATNPPYLRSANIPALLRAEYADVVPDYARADLLHSFLDRCARLLTPDGQIAVVAADRVLFNANAARLRTELGRRFAIAHLERLDPATTFYRPKNRRAGTPPRIHPVGIVFQASARGGIPLTETAIYPGAQIAVDPNAIRLGDVAHVRLAPWLGTPGIFVVDARVAATLPAKHLVPAVDTDDIDQDDNLGLPTRFALRTYGDEEPPQELLAHIDGRLHSMAPRGRRSPRWLPPETWTGTDRPSGSPRFDLS